MEKDVYRVSVIIPNYNRKKDLERLLPSIAKQTFDDYEVTIIDDCSPDKSAVEYIRNFIKDHQNMRLVENSENIGFVRTCNKGIRLANGEYICILTNDTEVANNFVQRNVEILDADIFIGVLSCIIIDKYGNNWFSGGSLKSRIPTRMEDDFQDVRSVDYVAGTACFYRKEVFDKIGLLNEYFVMYHEDVEFCLRVRAETSSRTCMYGEKLVTHHFESSSAGNKMLYYGHRNLILVLKKYSPKSIPGVLLFFLREAMNLALISLMKLRPSYMLLIPKLVKGTVVGLLIRGKI